jgi:hypothetical protein
VSCVPEDLDGLDLATVGLRGPGQDSLAIELKSGLLENCPKCRKTLCSLNAHIILGSHEIIRKR